MATLMAYSFGTKHNMHNYASALETTRGLQHRLKTTWTLVHKRVKIGRAFLPTLRKFYILVHCHASPTDGAQPNFAKQKEVNGDDVSQIRWRRIANVNATIEIRLLVTHGTKNIFP